MYGEVLLRIFVLAGDLFVFLFFGLAAATALVLVIVPCAYAVLEDLQAFARRPRQVIGRLFFDEPARAGGDVG